MNAESSHALVPFRVSPQGMDGVMMSNKVRKRRHLRLAGNRSALLYQHFTLSMFNEESVNILL